jgi:hypothetical protein
LDSPSLAYNSQSKRKTTSVFNGRLAGGISIYARVKADLEGYQIRRNRRERQIYTNGEYKNRRRKEKTQNVPTEITSRMHKLQVR